MPTKKINTFFDNIALVRFITAKSKKLYLPGFKVVSLYDVVKGFFRQLKEDDLPTRASGISFNFAMAIAPTTIFLFTLIPFIPINESFIKELYDLIKSIVPGENNYTAIVTFLDDFLKNPRNGLLSFGFLLSLFFASNAVMGIMRAFDKDLQGFKKRKGLAKRGTAIKITLVIFVLFFICLALLIAQGKVLSWLGIENAIVRSVIVNLRWVVILLLFLAIISYIYRAAPSVHKKWNLITPGSILATTLMLIFALGFSWWTSNVLSYNKIYGSLGTFLIILIMIFLNSLSLLIGFELNASIYSQASLREEASGKELLVSS